MQNIYSKGNQRDTVEELLGTVQISVNGKSEEIIQVHQGSSKYFAKGHLVPELDFIFEAEQDSTFYFINVAPQFREFSKGNWNGLEMYIRTYADRVQRDIKVFTGTFETLTFPNEQGNEIKISMFIDGNVPAPLFYWKVVHDPEINQAIAFIGMNNPYAEHPPQELCENKCSTSSIASESYCDTTAGYIYCCEVKELKSHIPYLPDLQGVDLLSDQKPTGNYCPYFARHKTNAIMEI